MADLTKITSVTANELVGSTSTGVPETPIGSDSNGNLFVKDGINVSSQYQAISLGTSAVEAKGAASRLLNRKTLIITPTNGTIYWGTSSSVTTTTGQPLNANQTLSLSFTDNVPVYIIAASTTDVRVLEAS